MKTLTSIKLYLLNVTGDILYVLHEGDFLNATSVVDGDHELDFRSSSGHDSFILRKKAQLSILLKILKSPTKLAFSYVPNLSILS